MHTKFINLIPGELSALETFENSSLANVNKVSLVSGQES